MLPLKNRRILIVDDVADNLFLMQTILEAEGYQVETASSGAAALDTLEHSAYDLVLLDVMMPDMNGFEVTERIRQGRSPRLPILLITAHDASSISKGLHLGANGFVRKPVDFEHLLFEIETVLQKQPDSAAQTHTADNLKLAHQRS